MSRMQPFGPGPGQYLPQTTFNPTMQPTPLVEQKQSLFGQLMGLVPVAAEVGAQAINLSTDIKKQDYLQREAQAKDTAIRSGDISGLERFYSDELNRDGWIPLDVQRSATEGQTAAFQLQQRIEEQTAESRIKKAQDEQEQLDKQIGISITNDIARLKAVGELSGEYNTSFAGLQSLLQKHKGTKHEAPIYNAIRELSATEREAANRITLEATQAKTAANSIADQIFNTINSVYASNPNAYKIGGSEFTKSLISGIIANTPGMELTEFDSDGLPVNMPELRNALIVKQNQWSIVKNAELQKEARKDFILNFQNTITQASAAIASPGGADNFVEIVDFVVQNKQDFSPQEFANIQSSFNAAFADTLQTLTQNLNSNNAVQTLGQTVFNMVKIEQALKDKVPTPAEWTTAINRLGGFVKNSIANQLILNVTSDPNSSGLLSPESQLNIPILNEDGTTRMTVGQFDMLQQIALLKQTDDGAILSSNDPSLLSWFPEDAIMMAQATGNLGYIRDPNDPAKERFLAILFDAYDQKITNHSSNTGPGESPTVTLRNMKSGVPTTEQDRNKLNFPSEMWSGSGPVPKEIQRLLSQYQQYDMEGNPLGPKYTEKQVTQAYTDPSERLDKPRIEIMSAVAAADVALLNGQLPNSKIIQTAFNNLNSSDRILRQQGLTTLAIHGGLQNSAIRNQIDSKWLTPSNIALLANFKNSLTKNSNGEYSLTIPEGQSFDSWVQDFQTLGSMKSVQEVPEASWTTASMEMGLGADTIINPKLKSALYLTYLKEKPRQNSDIKAVMRETIHSMGFVVNERIDGNTELIPNVNGTFLYPEKRQDWMNRWFKTYIPENQRDEYAMYFGLEPGLKFEYFDELLAIKLNTSLDRVYELQWHMDYSNGPNDMQIVDASGKPMEGYETSPERSFSLGGHLRYYNPDTKQWNGMFAVDPVTKGEIPLRLSPNHTMKFSELSVPQDKRSFRLYWQPREEQTASNAFFNIIYPDTWATRVGTEFRKVGEDIEYITEEFPLTVAYGVGKSIAEFATMNDGKPLPSAAELGRKFEMSKFDSTLEYFEKQRQRARANTAFSDVSMWERD